MANDPRKTFSVSSSACPKAQSQLVSESQDRKDFLDTLGKIGDLEILNDLNLGGVGEGLRTLASVADSIRVGQSVVPGREGTETYNSTLGKIVGTAVDAVNEGATAVLDTLGLGAAFDVVSNFYPSVANRAWAQAQDLFGRIKEGNFKLSDIPEIFSDLQNLESLAKGIFGGGVSSQSGTRDFQFCGASPYAMDLISRAPKFKFLFVVDILFSDAYSSWNDMGRQMAFVVKTSSRPNIEFEYEDINMYNFRTRVAKRTVYEPMNMAFYDDNKNSAHLFYTAYMRAMSPIANIKQNAPESYDYETKSMDWLSAPHAATFNSTGPLTNGHSASLGALADNSKSVIQRIRLYHIFDYGRLMNIYNFYNPRVLEFEMSDLTMLESGDGTEFEMRFAYDGLFIDPGWSVLVGGDNINLAELTSGGLYPIRFNDYGTLTKSDNSQDVAPIAQDQLAEAPQNALSADSPIPVNSVFTASKGITAIDNITNFSQGITGAINDAMSGVVGAASSAIGAVNSTISAATGLAGNVLGSVAQTIGNAQSTASAAVGAASRVVNTAQQTVGVVQNTAKTLSSLV